MPALMSDSSHEDTNFSKREVVFISKKHPELCCIVVYNLVDEASDEARRPSFCPLLVDPPDATKSEAVARRLVEEIVKTIFHKILLGADVKTLPITECVSEAAKATTSIAKIQRELKEIGDMMEINLAEVLRRGKSCEKLAAQSDNLREQSAKFERKATEENRVDIWYYLCCPTM